MSCTEHRWKYQRTGEGRFGGQRVAFVCTECGDTHRGRVAAHQVGGWWQVVARSRRLGVSYYQVARFKSQEIAIEIRDAAEAALASGMDRGELRKLVADLVHDLREKRLL